MQWNRKGSFYQTSQKLLTELLYKGCLFTQLQWWVMQTTPLAFVCGAYWAWEVWAISVIFLKMPFCDFTSYFSVFVTNKPSVFFSDVLNMTYHSFILSPDMIHFAAVDFSECRSEEAMFLLTLSVFYITKSSWQYKRILHKNVYGGM